MDKVMDAWPMDEPSDNAFFKDTGARPKRETDRRVFLSWITRYNIYIDKEKSNINPKNIRF